MMMMVLVVILVMMILVMMMTNDDDDDYRQEPETRNIDEKDPPSLSKRDQHSILIMK